MEIEMEDEVRSSILDLYRNPLFLVFDLKTITDTGIFDHHRSPSRTAARIGRGTGAAPSITIRRLHLFA